MFTIYADVWKLVISYWHFLDGFLNRNACREIVAFPVAVNSTATLKTFVKYTSLLLVGRQSFQEVREIHSYLLMDKSMQNIHDPLGGSNYVNSEYLRS